MTCSACPWSLEINLNYCFANRPIIECTFRQQCCNVKTENCPLSQHTSSTWILTRTAFIACPLPSQYLTYGTLVSFIWYILFLHRIYSKRYWIDWDVYYYCESYLFVLPHSMGNWRLDWSMTTGICGYRFYWLKDMGNNFLSIATKHSLPICRERETENLILWQPFLRRRTLKAF